MATRFILGSDTYGTVEVTAPSGWKTLDLEGQRHPDLMGIIRSFSVNTLLFYGDGRRYLKTIHETDYINKDIRLFIDEFDEESGNWNRYFIGQIDPEFYEDDGTYVSARIQREGWVQKAIDRLKVKVNLESTTSLDGGSLPALVPTTINFPARVSGALYQLDEATVFGSSFNTYGSDLRLFIAPGFNVDVSDHGTVPGSVDVPVIDASVGNMPAKFTATDSGTFEVKITGDWEITYTGATGSVKLIMDIGSLNPTLIDESGAASGSFSYTQDTTLAVSDELKLYWDVTMPNLTDQVSLVLTNVVVDVRKKVVDNTTSTARSLTLYEALKRCLQHYTGQQDPLRSNYLGYRTASTPNVANGAAAFTGVFTGKQLRGYPGSENPLTFHFKEIFDAGQRVWGYGMTTKFFANDLKFSIEHISDLFTDQEIITLDSPNVEEILLDKEFFSTLKIGYKYFEEELEGTNAEVQSNHEYFLPVNSAREKDLVADAVGGDLTIELVRSRQLDSDAKRDPYDNRLFLLALDRSVDGNGDPSGLGSPENNFGEWNWRISPKRNLIRWKELLLRLLWFNTDPVKFQYTPVSAGRDRDIDDGLGTVDEDGNYNPDRADVKNKNIGYVLDDVLRTAQLVTFLNSDQLGVVKFRDPRTGTYKYGNVLDYKINLYRKTVTLTLIHREVAS